MRARLATIVAGAALTLAPAIGLAQSADDGPIATAPDAPRNTTPPPPDQPDEPPPAPAAYAPAPPAPEPPAPEPAAAAQADEAPPPAAAYAAPTAPSTAEAAPQPAMAAQAAGGPGAVAYATPAQRPSFLADTASKDALAGALTFAGAAMAISSELQTGDKLVSTDAIADPAAAIAHDVAEGYAAAHGGSAIDAPAGWDGTGAGAARYLVKVSTSGWGFTYYPLDWSHYHLTYDAKLELVDVLSRRVIAKATCSHKPNHAAEHFTYADLTGDGGATLKSQLKAIADECAAQFKAAVLKS